MRILATKIQGRVKTYESRRRRWNGALGVLLSAGLFLLSSPGMPLPWLVWVALVPFFWGLRQAATLREGGLLGLGFGWLGWFGSVWWLAAPLREILGMPGGAALGLTVAGCLLLAAPYAVAGGVVTRWIPSSGIAGALAAAAVFTLTTVWLGLVFQGNIAHCLYRYPVALQVLELGGVPLLLFAIYGVNWLLADAFLLFRERRNAALKLGGCAALIFCLVVGYGAVRLRQFSSEMEAAGPQRWITVGAVQPNIPIGIPGERHPAPESLRNSFFTALDQARELAANHPGIDLLVLPENPATFLFNQDNERRRALGQLIGATGIPVILNADARDAPGESGEAAGRYNIAVLVDANRDVTGSYVKIKRLPLVEYLPLEERLPWLRRWFPASLRVVEGPGPELLPVNDDVRVIPLICYEGTMSAFTRAFVREGGNLIVNQTNDSWFLRTRASEIHLALALCRSVENRVPMVRVTNSGVGVHVQANGSIVPGSKTGLFVESVTAFPLYVPPERALYARIGDSWLIAPIVFLAAFMITGMRRRAGVGLGRAQR